MISERRPGEMTQKRRSEWGQRGLDLLLGIPLLILLAPLFIIVAIVVRLDSAGPAFFLQERVGRFGKRFRIIKFRTMTFSAERQGPLITVGNDARVTRVGRLLRRWKIDELPQLFNLLRGEMSLVGPRPEVPRYAALYTSHQSRILEARPGITGPASLRFHDESRLLAEQADPEQYYRLVLMAIKIEEDLAYVESATVATDLLLVARTIARLGGW
jgi:lipopolysaccharide/colanic/teichoic acid biosynthesis glycosyltransferase